VTDSPVLLDCTTQDLERLKPVLNRLAVDLQGVVAQHTQDLENRDRIILAQASLDMIQHSVLRMAKRVTTPRFVRSISRAVRVARAFGSGQYS
jgi:predicted oxidoreductase